jgi:hypothetical protein
LHSQRKSTLAVKKERAKDMKTNGNWALTRYKTPTKAFSGSHPSQVSGSAVLLATIDELEGLEHNEARNDCICCSYCVDDVARHAFRYELRLPRNAITLASQICSGCNDGDYKIIVLGEVCVAHILGPVNMESVQRCDKCLGGVLDGPHLRPEQASLSSTKIATLMQPSVRVPQHP